MSLNRVDGAANDLDIQISKARQLGWVDLLDIPLYKPSQSARVGPQEESMLIALPRRRNQADHQVLHLKPIANGAPADGARQRRVVQVRNLGLAVDSAGRDEKFKRPDGALVDFQLEDRLESA